jgi:hypothetical protein
MVLAEIGYIPLDVAKRAKVLRRKEFMRSNDNSVTGWRHLGPCGDEGFGFRDVLDYEREGGYRGLH